MTGAVYAWKSHAAIPVDAEIAGKALESLRVRNNGRLSQHAIVEAARPADAPLHPAFEWNDHEAAELYRRQQAGYMLRMIVVQAPEQPPDAPPVRAFINIDEGEGERYYTSTAAALSDADLRARVLANAWHELRAWRDRYQEIEELAEVFAKVEEVGERLDLPD